MSANSRNTDAELIDFEGRRLRALLEAQREASRLDGPPSAEERIDRLDRAITMLRAHEGEIVEAIVSDFGHRSPAMTRIADVGSPIQSLSYAKRHLREWMAPDRRSVSFPINVMGGRAWIQRQPLGVIGIISPWNYPFVLTMTPLTDALAAGNRVMIKPSEYTPSTSALMARLVAEAFDPTEITVVTGGAEVGAAFASLPFDHIIFTGSPRVGRVVMRAAAENLVPVTLELGGKNPAIIGRSKVDLSLAAGRIANAKMTNAGQICMAPDYVLLPEGKIEPFVERYEARLRRLYPTLLHNDDYTSIINEGHYQRLLSHLEDARAKGARLVELNPAGEDFSGQRHRKLPPTLILDPTEEMTVMQEEIFGPLLAVMSYRDLDEAIRYVNDHPRPLSLYFFGRSREERDRVLERTHSGGVTVNDAMMHYLVPDLPFGGVGESGFGAYRGVHGFQAFSHAKGICQLPALDVPNPTVPPFGRLTGWLASLMTRG